MNLSALRGSVWPAPGVVGFILACHCGRRVRSGWFGSFERAQVVFVWFIRARTGGRRVHLDSFGKFGCAPGVFELIQVHSGEPRGSSGSLGSATGYSGSFRRAPGIVGFIRDRLVLSGAPRGSSGSLARVHSGSPRVSLGSLGGTKGVVWLIGACHGGNWVNSGSFGSFAFACFIWSRSGVSRVHSWLIRAHPGGHGVHWGSLGSLWRATVVVGFILVRFVHSGTPLGSLSSIVLFCYFRARPWSCRVHSEMFGSFGRASTVIRFICVHLDHSGASLGSSGTFSSFGCAQGVVEFIQVHSGAHRGSSDSFAFFWLIWTLPVCRRIYWGSFASFTGSPVVVGLIRVGLVNSGEPKASSYSLGSFVCTT